MASSHAIENEDKAKSGTNDEKINDATTEIEDPIVAPDEAYKNVLQFAKDNHLKYKRNNTYCKVCDVKISSSLKRLKEHVAEQTHKDKAVAYVNVVIPKVELSEFIINEVGIETFFLREVVINDRFCLSFGSYETMSELGDMIRCHTCEVSLNPDEAGRHVRMWQHERGKQTSLVLTSFETEFVREVRPGVYHCGFCNFIEGSMKGLKNHLKSITHINKKTHARLRLNEHMPDVMEMRAKEIFHQCLRRGMRNLFL